MKQLVTILLLYSASSSLLLGQNTFENCTPQTHEDSIVFFTNRENAMQEYPELE
jgi:hypothetical protein